MTNTIKETWFHLVGINPEPWTATTVSKVKGRTMGFKSEQLKVYQGAVKDALEGQVKLDYAAYSLRFYFWRRLDEHDLMKKQKSRGHQADATNMQKALEDALQGVIIGNDRDVREISSVIMEQSMTTEPRILVCVQEYAPPVFLEYPAEPIVPETDFVPAEEYPVEDYF